MQTPEPSLFLDLLRASDPKLLVPGIVVLIAWFVIRVRSGAALDPFERYRPVDDDEGMSYTLEELRADFRKDYDPADKWNHAPANHDRL